MSPKQQKTKELQGQNQKAEFFESNPERFHALFGKLLEGVQILDHDWRYLYLNAVAERHNRRPNQELLGKKYTDMWPGIEETNVFSVIKDCMEERTASHLENPFVFPDGTEGWFVLSIQPIPEGVFILSFDITERVRAEKQVAQMKRLYATLSQVNQTIVRVKDPSELYQSICDVSAKFGEFSLAWVGLLDEASGAIKPVAANGLDETRWPFPIVNIKSGPYKNEVISQAFLTSKVVTSKDIQSDERTQSLYHQIQDYDFHSLAVVPFRLAGRTIGVLCLISPETGFFNSKEEISLLEEMGLDISFALDTMETQRIKRQWADAFEHCGHGLVIGDPTTNCIRTCNPAFAREHGGTIEEFISMPLVEMYAPNDREQIKQYIAHSDRTGSVRFEANKVRKDGSMYAVQMDLVSVRDQYGNLLYRVATQENITERKQAEQALLESWERYRSLFENNPHPMWVYDLETLAFLMVNDAAVNHYGYSREEFLRMTLRDIRPEDDITSLLTNVEQDHAELQYSTGWRHRKKDGIIIDVEISSHALQFEDRAARLVIANDITERKQAEKAVSESAQRFRRLFTTSPDAILLIDPHDPDVSWPIVDCNEAACRMNGYKREELIGQTIDILNTTAGTSAERTDYLDRLRREEVVHTETFHRHRNGNLFPVEVSTSLINFEGRELVMGIDRDITERKRAEEALRESETRFRSPVENSSDEISIIDANGKLLYESPTANPTLGYQPGEFLGENLFQLIHPDDLERVQGQFARLLQEPSLHPRQQFRLHHQNGDWRWVEAVGTNLLSEPSVGGIVINYYDITERVQVDAKLQASESRYRLATRATNDIIWEWNAKTHELIWSENAQLVLGYLPEEIGPNESWWDEHIHPADRERIVSKMDALIRGNESIWSDEYRFRRRDGSYAYISDRGYIEREASGDAIRMVGAMSDITERLRADQALQEIQSILSMAEEVAQVGSWKWDLRTQKVTWSDEMFRMFGVEREGFDGDINRVVSERIHPDDMAAVQESNRSVLEHGKPIPLSYRIVHPDGTERTVWAQGKLVRDETGQPIALTGYVQDITKRKQIEENLVANQRTLKLFVEHAPAAIAMFDRDMKYIAVSRRYLSDYRLPYENLVGRSHYEVFPEIPERWKEIHTRCLAGAVEKEEEDPFLRVDGILDWIRWEIHPWYEETGGIGGILLFSEVITERKQEQEHLRESEKKYRDLINGMNDTVWVIDFDTTILDVNHTASTALGYTREELLSMKISAIDVDLTVEQIQNLSSNMPRDKFQVFESWHTAKDGRKLPVEVSSSLVSYMGKTAIMSIARDITERKQTEEALQLSEERHRQISSLISDYVYSGMIFPNGAAKTEWVSGAMEQMTGYTLGEINQLPAGFSTLVLPEDLEKIEKGIPALLENQSVKVEYRIRRKDGEIRWFRDYMDYQPGEGPDPVVRMVGAVQDITEQVRAEREIQERTEDLLIINALNEAVNRGENFQMIVEVFGRETRTVFDCNDITIYLFDSDAKFIEMQNNTFSPEMVKKIEKLIRRPIPRIRLQVKPGSYFARTLAKEQGQITTDPNVIKSWIEEFTETTFLPEVVRPVIKKLVPQIYNALGIKSVISIPLISSGQTIGILDMSSKGLFTEHDLHRIRSISHQMTAAIMRKRAEEQVRLQLRRLSALGEIDRAITSSLDMRLSLDVVLSEVLTQLDVDAAAVLLLNGSTLALEYCAGKGFQTSAIRQSRMRLGEGLAGRVGMERRLLRVSSLPEVGEQFVRSGLLRSEGFIEYVGVPLIAKGLLKGVLEVFHRTPLNPDMEWINYLETLGGQTAIAIDNAQMFEGMQKSNLELIAAYDATIVGWSHAMDLRDEETEGHSQRVTELTLELAAMMGIREQEQVHIRRGALLHDIGKLGVPDQILHKPGKLNEEEWASMRRHPTYAFEMLSPISYLRPALDIPYCHHEKWDGSGYPRGLQGEQIPLSARIFAVVDVWDALRSDRPYRAAWSEEKVIKHINDEAGKHFDPQVVQVFLEFITSR